MIKVAPTQTHQVSVRQVRSWFVPFFIWFCLLGMSLGAAAVMVHHILAGGERRVTPDPLISLQPMLGGQTVVVPPGAGIWVQTLGSTQVVVARAVATGEEQRVNLCTQRVRAKDDPNRLYPVILLGSIAQLSSPEFHRASRRNPLIVAAEDASGMPGLTVSGNASDDPKASRLTLQVHSGTKPGAWKIAMANTTPGVDSESRFAYIGLAWLLWSPQVDSESHTIGHADTARFSRAVRIRTVQQAGCLAGALEWQLFTAQGANEDSQARVWVKAMSGTGDPLLVRLNAGSFRVPQERSPKIEDRELFERALAQGMLKRQEDGTVAVAPSDLARANALRQDTSFWAGGDQLGAAELATVKALHRTENGNFVRTQVARFNASQYWMAVRVRSDAGTSAGSIALRGGVASWLADANGESLTLSHGLPPVAVRLFDTVPVGWSEWLRVSAPQGARTAEVSLRLPQKSLSAGATTNDIELLVLGQILSVNGAVVVANDPACTGQGCVAPDMLRHLRLKPESGAQDLVLKLRPEPRFNVLKPAASEQLRVQIQGVGAKTTLAWVDPPSSQERKATPAVVTVSTREGATLFDGDVATPSAIQMGLAPLVGLSSSHDNSLAGNLMRLGQTGDAQVQVRTTLDSTLQSLTHSVLACIGQKDGNWNSRLQSCDLQKSPANADPRRRANAVVLDASNGDILAAASGVTLPKDVLVDELIAFDRFNPSASPLSPGMWSHDGGVSNGAGSCFKVVSGLGLELAAQREPSLLPLLGGATTAQWNAFAAKSAQSFRMDSACYPQPCGGNMPHLTNFRNARPLDQLEEGKFGVAQALKASVNTWFAFMAERIDGTVPGDNADVRPMGITALHAERPILAMAHQLGFERPLQLDGGLLPESFPWQIGDYLQTVPSRFDAIDHTHGVRQMALGLRMQATPLQMARVAAAVATGYVTTPRLLLQLNQRDAARRVNDPLTVPLQRIREGMREVVDAGTARGAFQSAELKRLKAGVFGKTGTAPIVGTNLNSAWFVGYILPGTLPGEQRTLAFAVQIRYSPLTGGAHAAPVIANLMETLALSAAQGEIHK